MVTIKADHEPEDHELKMSVSTCDSRRSSVTNIMRTGAVTVPYLTYPTSDWFVRNMHTLAVSLVHPAHCDINVNVISLYVTVKSLIKLSKLGMGS